MLPEEVFQLVRQIPEGRVSTYGAIAKTLDKPRGSRLVGWIMNKAHVCEQYVPAHRVVNRNGLLSGKIHFETPTAMEEKLAAEGIIVIDDQIQNFSDVVWSEFKLD
jgi:methylated-DNA-protein-cysteine methyltransferase-like protein